MSSVTFYDAMQLRELGVFRYFREACDSKALTWRNSTGRHNLPTATSRFFCTFPFPSRRRHLMKKNRTQKVHEWDELKNVISHRKNASRSVCRKKKIAARFAKDFFISIIDEGQGGRTRKDLKVQREMRVVDVNV